MRKRILIVNCHFDETRRSVGRRMKIPQPLAPVLLAGVPSPEHCDVRIYNELYSGPLEDAHLLGWPDMLVLTGLLTSLDRMLHLTAYARTRNPRVVVVAGGHVTRALPRFMQRRMDYSCQGDIEEFGTVLGDAFGPRYVNDRLEPRFDLAPYIGRFSYVETSRNCNYRCAFCILTAENRRYRPNSPEFIRAQLEAAGRRHIVTMADNNFFGNNRTDWLARLGVIGEMRDRGYYDKWVALVTSDFFYDRANLRLARDAGCTALFTGLESFDVDWLRRQNKLQNTRIAQFDMIRACLDEGIMFMYGLMLDVMTRSLADLSRELDLIVGNPEIPLPSYVCVPTPLIGTPFFYDCLEKKMILPRTRIRDLDGTTVSVRTYDSLDRVAGFVRDLQRMRGYRTRIAKHSVRFVGKYLSRLTPSQIAIALSGPALIAAPLLATLPDPIFGRNPRRTHVSTTDVLDPQYRPVFRVDSRFESYFQPAMVTDEAGEPAVDLAEDLVENMSGYIA